MNKNKIIKRDLLSPPGDTIRETINMIGMNQYELAERLGKNIKNVNQMIKGKESISPETAIALEKVLQIPADFWLERERRYQKELAEIKFDEYLEKCRQWISGFPTKPMINYGWLTRTDNHIELMKKLLNFLGIAAPEQWEKIYAGNNGSAAFRMSLVHSHNPKSVSVWLRKGEIDARELQLKEFSKENFKEALISARELTRYSGDFYFKLQKICADAGVALIFTPMLPKAPIYGAARWIFNNRVPLIQLSDRYKTNDHLWFTFFHEAGHILLHGKKDIFLEDAAGILENKTKEDEADKFARNILIPDADYYDFIKNTGINDKSILNFSRKIKIHPGILVGRLQRDKLISYSKFNYFKVKCI